MEFINFWKFIGSISVSKWIYKISRNLSLFLHLVKHSGRQEFHIGWTNNLSTLSTHLIKNGFEPSHYAWIDQDEVLSLRKIDKNKFQYHLRLYSDGEIRGHHEYAPDRCPLKHYYEHKFEARKEDFKRIIGNKYRCTFE
ncbi:MAG: hypothetical protein WCV90_03305 [Candidatus Woesearchaeota archaeon]|jgi:hypothetical protein